MKKLYIETYGCQMNVNDTEVIFSILAKEGYARTERMEEADVIMANTWSGTTPSSASGAGSHSSTCRRRPVRASSSGLSAAWRNG